MPVNDIAPYQVLARKYRPQRFDDLIGQEAMVTTLRNAFNLGRIAHAYILTGVRGVGKTTTARILARALNYVGPGGEDEGPKIDVAVEGRHCRAIAESRHPDVMEMDAASRTGVGDIRELIEGVRYAPLEARYKVYIIDEVHMLSTAAFNALLKTLEEPPPHVKFIFATTEIRKVPVTVLSRCQRFDLRRVAPDVLARHLRAIADREGVAIDDESLSLIARAAEGSVRDALSLLDQALVQGAASGAGPGVELVRAMIGLADRGQVWDLLDRVFAGDAKGALDRFSQQYAAGADPSVILRDMLEIVHLLTRVKAAGAEAADHGPAGEADAARARDMAERLSMNALTRAWSLLMKGMAETREAPDAEAAGEMAIIRMAYAADLPTPDEALRSLKNAAAAPAAPAAMSAGPPAALAAAPPRNPFRPQGGSAEAVAAAPMVQAPAAAPSPGPAPAPAPAPKPALSSFLDVVRLAGQKKDQRLKVELESYAHVISFAEGRIEMRLEDRAPSDFAGRLTQRLKEWTGRHWIVTLAGEGGAPTLRDARTAEVMSHPLVKKAFEVFPDAEIRAIRDAVEVPPAGVPAPEDVADEQEL
ncbi:MAG: DNA polymerase III subunit gamma/tau [Parvularculaceae bacterium]|jgi:DNA polymerase-3 subunit gamma/tau|nr:DNA polymerase III subunit gamma/tau [Parvularculaceae bacterium]